MEKEVFVGQPAPFMRHVLQNNPFQLEPIFKTLPKLWTAYVATSRTYIWSYLNNQFKNMSQW